MIRGGTKLFLELVAALLLLLLLAVAALLWRLQQGPIPLDFLNASVGRLLSDRATGRLVQVGRSALAWNAGDRMVELSVAEIRIAHLAGNPMAETVGRDSDGAGSGLTPVLFLPALAIRFEGRALLRGELVPLDLEIQRPTLRLVRAADGAIRLGLTPPQADATVSPPAPTQAQPGSAAPVQPMESVPVTVSEDALTDLATLLDTDPAAARPLRLFAGARLNDGTLIIDDRKLGRLWRLTDFDLRLTRSRRQLAVTAQGVLDLPDAKVRLTGDARWRLGDPTLDVTAKVSGAPVAALLALDPRWAAQGSYDGSVSVEVAARLTTAGKPERVSFDLALGAGELRQPLMPGPVPVTSLNAKGSVDVPNQILLLDQAQLRIEGIRIGLSGRVAGAGDALAVAGLLRIENTPIDSLSRLWPTAVAIHPRAWILANLSKGTVTEAEARFAALRPMAGQDWDLQSLDGKMTFEQGRVIYLPGLPPVEGVGGTARFNARQMDLSITSGTVRRLQLDEGKITITGLDVHDQAIDIGFVARGPVTDALTVLDAPKLGYVSRLGFKAASASGDVAARLGFQFPLEEKLTFDQVKLAAAANLRNAALPAALRGQALSEGDLRLDLDGTGMEVHGHGKLAGIPLKLDWIENFSDDAPFRRRFDASGLIPPDGQRAFGLDFRPYLDGPVAAEIDYTEIDKRRASLSAQLDLAQTDLAIADLGWRKAPGAAATAQIDIGLADGRFAQLDRLDFAAPGLSFAGSGRFEGEAQLTQVKLDRAQWGQSQVALDYRRDGKVNVIALRGPRLDVSALPDSDPDQPDERNLDLSVDLAQVILAPDREARAVRGQVRLEGGRWRRAALSASLGAAQVDLAIDPDPAGRKLRITANDTGDMLRGMGLFDRLKGGKLVVTGRFDDTTPTEKLNAHAEITDFRVLRVPALANLLAIASITGIPEQLSGAGIAFTRLYADIERTRDQYRITDSNASGQALGINVKGTVGRRTDLADLSGLLVPINGINQLLGTIPLLGDLLTGGRNGGLFAANFTLKGPIDDPAITVNPLSVLTPGLLRRLFDLPLGGGSGAAAPSDEFSR